ncbi:MAG: alpha/beta hydrolase fold domain-containing protein [Calditrichia bacterium]
MPGIRPFFYRILVKHIIPLYRRKNRETGEIGGTFNAPRPPKRLTNKYIVSEVDVNRRKLFTVSPRHSAHKHHVFYLHGGGYIAGISAAHWYFVDQLIKKLKCTVSMYDYPLAPKQQARETLHDTLAAYNTLFADGGARITVMGDSAGAGMSLAIVQMLRDAGLRLPERVIGLSPWMDLTMCNEEIEAIAAKDFFLDEKYLIQAGKAYAGNEALNNPLLSPVHADFRGLPPIHFFMGTGDILMPDTRQAVRNAAKQGVEIDYREYDDMFHVWMLFPIPEAKKVLREIKQIVLRK